MQTAAMQAWTPGGARRDLRAHVRRSRRHALLLGVVYGSTAWFGSGCRDVSSDHGYCDGCAADAKSGITGTESNPSASSADASVSARVPEAATAGTDAMVPNANSAPPVTQAHAPGAAGMAARAGSTAGTQSSPDAGGASALDPNRAGTASAGSGGVAGVAGQAALDPTLACARPCPDNAPVCDASRQCVECTENDTHACPNTRPVCDVIGHTCVECNASDTHACPSAKPACDPTTHTCSECTDDDLRACPTSKPVCDLIDHSCVECTNSAVQACPNAKPVCDPTSHTCVECNDTGDHACPSAKPVCDTSSHSCFECTERDTHACSSPKSVCDPASHSCVECLGSRPDTCSIPQPRCDDTLHQCVECLEARDCTDPTRARCDAQQCTACESDADCALFPRTPVCERARGACVACTPETEARSCPASQRCDAGSNSCVPRSNPRALCEACNSDADCAAGARCASPTYPASARVCLPPAQPGPRCTTAPYLNPLAGDQGGSEVCAPSYSCKAVLAALGSNGGATCSDGNAASVCGDGLCSGGRCRYPCAAPNECPAPFQCDEARGACVAAP